MSAVFALTLTLTVPFVPLSTSAWPALEQTNFSLKTEYVHPAQLKKTAYNAVQQINVLNVRPPQTITNPQEYATLAPK